MENPGSDNEFNLELERLLSDERKKSLYYTISVEKERQLIIDSFADHYVAMSLLDSVITFDDFLKDQEPNVSSENEDEDAPSELVSVLSELVRKDIEMYDVLADGEMQVSGNGIYLFYPEDGDMHELEMLEDGATLTGDVKWYSVADMISYEAYLHVRQSGEYIFDDIVTEVLGVWLVLDNVTLTNAVGETTFIGSASVPFSYPKLQFDKIIHQENDIVPDVEIAEIPIQAHFKSDFMLQVCNDIENDLNHNDYEGEEAHQVRAQHSDEVSIYMGIVDREEVFEIDAFTAVMQNGDQETLEGVSVQYLDPTIMNCNGTWRVVHAFSVLREDGRAAVAHILPEYLLSIQKKS